ncbi:CPBP family intramembrane metalloprotease [Vibrio sp. 1-Bac 57]
MTFYILGLAILSVFPFCKITFFKQPIWLWLLMLSVLSAALEGYINIVGLVAITFYVALYYGTLNIKQPIINKVITILFIATSLSLALHYVPGFNNLPIVVNEQVSSDAIAYTLYANFDKGIAGLLLSAYYFSTLAPKRQRTLDSKGIDSKSLASKKLALKQPALIIIGTILATLSVALLLGIVSFNPKVPDFWLAFIAINLLFTCVAEEALFRGLLQTKLSQQIISPRFAILAPIIIACVFALAHFMGGVNYILVSVVAGFGYGYILYKTQRLEWAILCHWLVNVCHFFLFTYPMIKLQA